MKVLVCVYLLAVCCGAQVFEPPVCEIPIFPKNTFIEMTHRGVNGTVTYSCNDGYWYTGTNPQVCRENKQWTGTSGSCKLVQCPDIPIPLHGHVNIKGYGHKDTATVKCNEGYIYSHPENNTLTCRADNTWGAVIGECEEVNCRKLADPPNCRIEYTGHSYKDTASINCDMGYKYTKPESMTRTCQGDNTWSLQLDGECRSIACPAIPSVEHRIVTSNGTSYGSVVGVSCTAGYSLQGSSTVTCTGTGQWSDVPGECEVSPTWNKQALWCLVLLPLAVIGFLIAALVWRRTKRFPKQTADSEHGIEVELTDQQAQQQGLLQQAKDVPLGSGTGAAYTPETNIPQDTHDGSSSLYHVSFNLMQKFDAGKSDPQSPSYMGFASIIQSQVKAAIKKTSGENAEVFVNCISEQKRMIHLTVTFAKSLAQEQILKALDSLDSMVKILSESISFKDAVSAALAGEIIKQKHVKDAKLDRRVDLETQYVRLRIISKHDVAEISRDVMELPDKYQKHLHQQHSDEVTDEDIVTSNETQKYVVIRGRAGIGKTTLMQRLMWRWACGEWATHLKAIFLLNLRVLAAITGEVDLAHILSNCGVYRPGYVVTATWIEDNQEQIGLVLDGLDELYNFDSLWENHTVKTGIQNYTTAIEWSMQLLKRKCLSRCTLFVTSRPFQALSYLTPTSMIEVMGLTHDRVMEFIKKNVNQEKRTLVEKAITSQPILLSVSAITFYCSALCHLLEHDITRTNKLITYTQTTSYITAMFIERSMKTDQENGVPSRSLKSICELAYKGLLKRTSRGLAQLVFDEQDLKDMTAEDVQWARQSGLFLQTEVPGAEDAGQKQLLGEFVHLFIQEFLAMAGLLMQAPEKIKKALAMLSTSGQFNMALLFLYGFAFDEKGGPLQKLGIHFGEGLEGIKDLQADLKSFICNIPDEMQLLQMIHESQSPEIARHVGKLKFRDKVEYSHTKMTVVDMMALTFLLQHSPTITTIDLKDTGLDLMSTKELCDFLRTNHTVTRLRLWDDGIDDANVKAISDALQTNSGLKKLEIISDEVTDTGLISLLTALHYNTTLQHLTLDYTGVDDKCAEVLLQALHVNNKIIVQLRSTDCSEQLRIRLTANTRIQIRY